MQKIKDAFLIGILSPIFWFIIFGILKVLSWLRELLGVVQHNHVSSGFHSYRYIEVNPIFFDILHVFASIFLATICLKIIKILFFQNNSTH